MKIGRASASASSKGSQKSVGCPILKGSPKSDALSGVYFGVTCLYKAMTSYCDAGPHGDRTTDLIDSMYEIFNALTGLLADLATVGEAAAGEGSATGEGSAAGEGVVGDD